MLLACPEVEDFLGIPSSFHILEAGSAQIFLELCPRSVDMSDIRIKLKAVNIFSVLDTATMLAVSLGFQLKASSLLPPLHATAIAMRKVTAIAAAMVASAAELSSLRLGHGGHDHFGGRDELQSVVKCLVYIFGSGSCHFLLIMVQVD